MPDLKTLIREWTDRGVSVREMERRATRAGFRVKYQTFSELANNPPLSFPKKTETIRGMAAALEVTERAIVLAYAESLGVDVGRVEFADLVPLAADEMSQGMRDAVLAVIREATKGADGASPEQRQKTGSATERRTPPMTAEEVRRIAEETIAARDAQIERHRNDPAKTPPPGRGSSSSVSDGDDTTTRGKSVG